MSDLFMDMQRLRHRWHNQQNTPPTSTSTTTATNATSTSDSPSSTQQQHVNEQIFSHHSKKSSAAGENADHNANYNLNNQKDNKIYKNYDDNADAEDMFENILSLKLKKPKHWKWELSTSKSCSNIALPRIMLYDHKGELLADAQSNNEGVYRQEDPYKTKRDRTKKRSHQSKSSQSEILQRAATVNLTHSIRQALEKEFNGLHIQEATPSPKPNSPISPSSCCSHRAIDLFTNDLPDYSLSRRSSSLKGVRFNIENGEDEHLYESHVPVFLPTPPSTITPTSSSSGPREKRKYRRSQSSGRSSAHSESILERFSHYRGRFSSPEYAEETNVHQSPRYFLRTCKAGTLVIKEDSFSQHPRRRKRPLKNRSSESLQSVQKFSFDTSLHTRTLASCKSPTPSDISCNRKLQPLRRRLTDGNVLKNKQLSTSEEDVTNCVGRNPFEDCQRGKQLRTCSQARNQTKDLNYSTDVHQNGKVR